MEYHFPDAKFPEEFLRTEELVLNLTSSLDVKKATGADAISARMLINAHNLLSHHLHTNCPLSPYQWGFSEGKSTTSALSFAHDCHNALDSTYFPG